MLGADSLTRRPVRHQDKNTAHRGFRVSPPYNGESNGKKLGFRGLGFKAEVLGFRVFPL